MSDFIPIMGTATHNLDGKNRIFIPAKHREALGPSFVVFPNIKDRRSLVISSVDYLKELMEKIKTNTSIPAKDRAGMINYLNGEGDTLSPDAQGRVVLSATLVANAGLSGPTVIHGCHDHAEIWNAEVFRMTTSEDAERYSKLFEEADLI